MPKNTKKQKDKSADFKKAKLKLGKGKKPANNAVDTSFKAHSIALPSQSIVADKSQAGPSTRRRHTLPELLSLLRHYSAGSRKDALAGLRELFSKHEELMQSSVSTVAPASCKLIGDDDASVRKAVIEFEDWYLHRIPKTSILPHASALMLFATSAQTHIFPEIRVDSIRLIDIFLDVFPEVVTSEGTNGHGKRVLHGYMGLLAGNISDSDSNVVNTSATVLSAQSKLVVISSLSHFLKASTIERQSQERSLWYLRNSFKSIRAYDSFDTRNNATNIASGHRMLLINSDQGGLLIEDFPILTYDSWSTNDTDDALQSLTTSPSASSSEGTTRQSIVVEKSIHHILIEFCLDYAPNAFINLGERKDGGLELRIVLAVLKLALSLYSPILQTGSEVFGREKDEIMARLTALLSRLAVYLPINGNIAVTAEVEELIQDLNLSFSQLYIIPLLWSAPRGSEAVKTLTRKPQSEIDDLLSRVGRWAEEMIRGKVSSNHPLGRKLSEDVAKSILPISWTLIDHLSSRGEENNRRLSRDLLHAITDQIQAPATTQEVKLVFIKFMTMIVLLQNDPDYIGSFKIQTNAPVGAVLLNPSSVSQSKAQLFEDWILYLPKLLWELGANKPIISLNILHCLMSCVQTSSKWSSAVASNLSQRFVPFFVVKHASRGHVFGPFRKFSDAEGQTVQKIALDLAFSLYRHNSRQSLRSSESEPSPQEILCDSADLVVQGTAHEIYWKTLRSIR